MVIKQYKVTNFITCTNKRIDLTFDCLDSLKNTDIKDKNCYLLVVCQGPMRDGDVNRIRGYDIVDDVIVYNDPRGISYNINIATEVAKFNRSNYINYIQNDMIVKDSKFVYTLIALWQDLIKRNVSVGCISGYKYTIDSEYKKEYKITYKKENFRGFPIHYRKHISAQNIFMSLVEWCKYFPIDYIDPTDGKMRGFPNDGRGSRIDWWMSTDSPNSFEKRKKCVVCIDGLMEERGWSNSTWKDRK